MGHGLCAGWPLISLTWAYRGGRKPVASYLGHMGLWDLTAVEGSLRPIRTRVADEFAALARGTRAGI
ncbi:MAG TPA: hypothetical protein VG106_02225 [Vicinamibacterales bacterium]|nr:hypothetical protein [Vicinamibacterales bacterium]